MKNESVDIVVASVWLSKHWKTLSTIAIAVGFLISNLWSAYAIKSKYDRTCETVAKHDDVLKQLTEMNLRLSIIVQNHEDSIKRMESFHLK